MELQLLRIMGVDPGTAVCGYGVIETDGREVRALDYGVVQRRKGALPERLRALHEGLTSLFERFEPDVVAVEGAFYGRNPRTALRMGEARGIVLLAASAAGAEIVEYAPAVVKKSVVGAGKAHKSQVQQMVRILLNLPELPQPDDAADALALALCYFHRLPAEAGAQ
jgi:crossover junction endodeoxyribonuclease RuvC